MYGYNVYLSGKWIDKVFYSNPEPREEVKRSLVNHDGYDPNIRVTRDRKSEPPKPKRINKYLYGWKLYVNYGQGWEYETFEATEAGYRENRKAYRENCNYPQKWTRGREENPEYKG